MTAREFVSQCAPGRLEVVRDTVVTGRATVAGDSCEVRVAAGVSLTFQDFVLTNEPGYEPPWDSSWAFLAVIGGDGSRIEVRSSRVVLRNDITLRAGQSSGGRVHVVNSTLRTDIGGVTLESSPEGMGGAVVVTDATLASGYEVLLAASCAGANCAPGSAQPSSGGTAIARRVVVPAGPMRLWTGTNGRTVGTDNRVRSRELALHTGEGGSCVSRGNVPDVPCTPPPDGGVPDQS